MSMIDQIIDFNKSFVAHSHCGACHMSYDHFHHDGFIIDSETGALEEIK